MSFDINTFDYEETNFYCPQCEELVILQKGERSCKCTRVGHDQMAVFKWYEVDEDYKKC